jgi:hypothetical protein
MNSKTARNSPDKRRRPERTEAIRVFEACDEQYPKQGLRDGRLPMQTTPSITKNLSWGDFAHFVEYTGAVMSLFPNSLDKLLNRLQN